MKVLHVSPTFYPATYYGGPMYALHELCNALAALDGIELKVAASDAAGPARGERVAVPAHPLRYPAGYDVYFHRRIWLGSVAPCLIAALPTMIRWADLVHLTATYSFPTLPTLLLCRCLGKPVVWSPRGALQRWEGSRRARAKWPWERLCDVLLVPRRSVLHLTTEREREASVSRIRNARPVVIPNGVELPDSLPARDWLPDGTLRLLFMGRLHPIKGLDHLLRAVAGLPGAFRLTLCGAGEGGYVRSLEALVARLGLEPRVRFAGHVEKEAKLRAFAEADLCVLPSFSENFGMAVAEALAHGVPVVASDRTPWREVEARGCGRCVPNDPESLRCAIEEMRGRDLAAMGARGRRWMQEAFSWEKIARRMAALYGEMLQRPGGRPSGSIEGPPNQKSRAVVGQGGAPG